MEPSLRDHVGLRCANPTYDYKIRYEIGAKDDKTGRERELRTERLSEYHYSAQNAEQRRQ
jgi:hypothetical protein